MPYPRRNFRRLNTFWFCINFSLVASQANENEGKSPQRCPLSNFDDPS